MHGSSDGLLMRYPNFYGGEDVSINTLPFNRKDHNGCEWVLTDLDGWWGLPEPETPNDRRPFTEDGSYTSSGRFMGRNIVMTGYIVPKEGGPRGVTQARHELNETLNLVRQTSILQVDEDVPKQSRVQIVGKPKTKVNNLNNALEFNVQFRAADPRKYGTTAVIDSVALPAGSDGRTYDKTFNYTYGTSASGGIINVNNEGSYNTQATLRVSGPVVNPTVELVEQGATLAFNIVLGMNDYLDIDLQSRTVTLNSTASRRGALVQGSQWFTIEPGDSMVRFNGIQNPPARPETPDRYNLVLNPSIVNDISGYTSTGDYPFGSGGFGVDPFGGSHYTLEHKDDAGFPAAGYLRATALTMPASASPGVGYANIAVQENIMYTASMYMRSPSLSGSQLRIWWYDGTNNLISVSTSDVFELNATTWVRTNISGLAPTGAVTAFVSTYNEAGTVDVGDIIDIDSLLFESGSILYDYFDGGTSNASWLGTPDNSVSFAPAQSGIPEATLSITYRSAWIE